MLTHGYLMAKEKSPRCSACGVFLSVKHILADCQVFKEARLPHSVPFNLAETLGPDPDSTENLLSLPKTKIVSLLYFLFISL